MDGPIDHLEPDPVIEHEFLEDLPPRIPVVPVENHTADKVCAMYETHRQQTPWSTRYRDLADLVRIVRDLEIDAVRLTAMLRHEQQRRRIPPELPEELRPPHASWVVDYPVAARRFAGFPADLHPLEASLAFAGQCLNPVLGGSAPGGRGIPEGGGGSTSPIQRGMR